MAEMKANVCLSDNIFKPSFHTLSPQGTCNKQYKYADELGISTQLYGFPVGYPLCL